MTQQITIIGPQDGGRRMTLAEFDDAEAVEGQLYELEKGAVVVVDVPDTQHFAQVDALRSSLEAYRSLNPKQIFRIGGGGECKILVTTEQSERHPDLALYKTPPPKSDVWSTWVPEIVVEVVSRSSVKRDYDEKPPEYLAFGVAEYWIVDADKSAVTLLRRSGGTWKPEIIVPGQAIVTRHLPGFSLDPALLFTDAAS